MVIVWLLYGGIRKIWGCLLLGEVDKNVAVGVENLGFGYKTKIMLLLIHNRQVPSASILKNLHYLTHRHGIG